MDVKQPAAEYEHHVVKPESETDECRQIGKGFDAFVKVHREWQREVNRSGEHATTSVGIQRMREFWNVAYQRISAWEDGGTSEGIWNELSALRNKVPIAEGTIDHHGYVLRLLNLMNAQNVDGSQATSENESTLVDRIVWPTELIYQTHHQLFPPERMCLYSGRVENGNQVRVTGVFDVTGVATAGHVTADPLRVHRAVIAMDNVGCVLAGWAHSHPGQGEAVTAPSPTDVNQHSLLSDRYSWSRLGVVMSDDGFCRVIESPAKQAPGVNVILDGEGVSEVRDGVYKLAL